MARLQDADCHTADIPPRLADHGPPPSRSTSGILLHATLLILSLLVLLASWILTVRLIPAHGRQEHDGQAAELDRVFPAGEFLHTKLRADGYCVVLPILDKPLPGSCAFRRITGIPCPGCGLTRSFISLAHGQWRRAWHFNPAGWLYFAIVLFQLPYRTFQLLRIRSGRSPFSFGRLDNYVLWALILTLFVQWIAGLLVQAVVMAGIGQG